MFHPDNSGSSGPLWLGDWKYQIGSSNTCTSSNNKTLNARLLARVITGCHYT